MKIENIALIAAILAGTYIIAGAKHPTEIAGGVIPSMKFPDVTFPSMKFPDVTFPSMKFPDVTFPSMKYPDIKFPSFQAPSFQAPSYHAPLYGISKYPKEIPLSQFVSELKGVLPPEGKRELEEIIQKNTGPGKTPIEWLEPPHNSSPIKIEDITEKVKDFKEDIASKVKMPTTENIFRLFAPKWVEKIYDYEMGKIKFVQNLPENVGKWWQNQLKVIRKTPERLVPRIW